eukprot:2230080-Amphidinium_carterae.1
MTIRSQMGFACLLAGPAFLHDHLQQSATPPTASYGKPRPHRGKLLVKLGLSHATQFTVHDLARSDLLVPQSLFSVLRTLT